MPSDSKNSEPTDLQSLGKLLWIVVGTTLVATGLAYTQDVLAAIGVGVLIFVSSFSVGALLGFLFGVPRVLSRSTESIDRQSTKAPDVKTSGTETKQTDNEFGQNQTPVLQSNTNLERISDWLTTMLIGVGLVELHKVNDLLISFRQFLSESALVFNNNGSLSAGIVPVIGPMVLVFGMVCGFMFMYLNTRLILIRLFLQIENTILGRASEPKLGIEETQIVQNAVQSDSFWKKTFPTHESISVNNALRIMFDFLYKPEGYISVIEMAPKLANSPAIQHADYWYYLAAAFGQQYKAAKSSNRPAEMEASRLGVLKAARQAVSMNETYRSRLQLLMTPGTLDDDLSELRDDPELKMITGT